MSEYFRVLKRIERDLSDAGVQPARPTAAPRLRSAAPLPAPAAQALTPAATPLPRGAAAAFARLFDNIRALASPKAVRTLVFAPASGEESVRTVIAGLAAHAESRGLSVLTLQIGLRQGRVINASTTLVGSGGPDGAVSLPFDLEESAAELAAWRERIESAADLVLVEGGPLEQSIDAAMLARACDGLVIVAASAVTARAALADAADRAKAVGCRTFGVVMESNSRDELPGWLRVLLSGRPPVPPRPLS